MFILIKSVYIVYSITYKLKGAYMRSYMIPSFFSFRLDCRSSSRIPMTSIHYSVADNSVFGNLNVSKLI